MCKRIVLAEVAAAVDAGNFRVHYAGYGPERGRAEPPGGAALATLRGGDGAPERRGGDRGSRRTAAFPAKVLAAVAADRWLVRLDNAGPQYDQVVDAAHLRSAEAPPAVAPPPS